MACSDPESEVETTTDAATSGSASQTTADDAPSTADPPTGDPTGLDTMPSTETGGEPTTTGVDDSTGTDPTGSMTTGDTSTTSPTGSSGSTGTGVEVPPTGVDDLLPWLQAGEYQDWQAESGVHDSAGPHFGGVRTFVNGPLFDSLSAGGDPHPIDAAAVKELYGAGNEVLGWSVSVKVQAGAGGDTWYWLEWYDGTTYGDGVGDDTCVPCHSVGTDHVRSPFPLQ